MDLIERSLKPITINDLKELFFGSMKRMREYFILGQGRKWRDLHDIENPLAAALCQGGALHHYDTVNGIKDFDVWFFYPFNGRHLPYRSIWNWDYKNPKLGRHPNISGFSGRKVDVILRSIKNYDKQDAVNSIYQFFQYENTSSAKELAKKAIVMLYPETLLGKVVWYKQEKLD